MKEVTLQDISHISGVSLPMLTELTDAGLLKASSAGEEGMLLFGEPELLQLQQILLYRELGVPEGMMMELMAPQEDIVSALLFHKEQLIDKMLRMETLLETIDLTLAHVRGEREVEYERWYIGFEKEGAKHNLYDAARKAANREGQTGGTESVPKWSKDDYLSIQKEADEIYMELCAAMDDRKTPDSPEVQSVIERHYQWVCHFYTPGKKIYSDLGDLYVEQEDFKKLYDVYDPKLAAYLRDAMKIYAETRL